MISDFSRKISLSFLRLASLKLVALTIVLFSQTVSAQELIYDGGFERGDGWNVIGRGWTPDNLPSNTYSGIHQVLGRNSDGSSADNIDSSLFQTVFIPYDTTSASLSYYIRVDSSESKDLAYDFLTVEIRDNFSGELLHNLVNYSNVDADGMWRKQSVSVPLNVVAGRNVRIVFRGTTDGSIETVFRVDDVSLTATAPSLVPALSLTGVSLSAGSMTVETTETVTIVPSPLNASLPSCIATDANGLSSSLITISGATVSINPNAPVISSSQTVKISCGSFSAVLTIQPKIYSSALAGITLSSPSILSNSKDAITILAVPLNATLPTCTALLPAFGIPNPYVKIVGAKVTLTANALLATEKKNIEIACGGFTATLLLEVPTQVTESVESDGTLTLGVKLQPLPLEVGKATRVWVAARLPASSTFTNTDLWFFLTPNGWQTLLIPNLDLLSFKTFNAVSSNESLVVPLGLPKDALRYYAIEILLGYQTEAGQFKNIGIIWK